MKQISSRQSNPTLRLSTGFLLFFALAGIIAGVGRTFLEIGFMPESIQAYYLGSEEAMTYAKEFP